MMPEDTYSPDMEVVFISSLSTGAGGAVSEFLELDMSFPILLHSANVQS